MITDPRNDLLAKAMVGRYRLGYIDLSLLIAGTLFEEVVNLKLKEFDTCEIWSVKRIENTLLKDKVDRLCELTSALENDSLYVRKLRQVFTTYRQNVLKDKSTFMSDEHRPRLDNVKKRLNNFRWLRNQIMHGKLSKLKFDEDKLIDDMITYIWSELAPGHFKSFLNIWEDEGSKGRVIDNIKKHTADYMIRGIDEVNIRSIDEAVTAANDDWNISQPDFGNLFVVRDKLVTLKKYLSQWLKENANHLHTNTLSTIDTTSGYVWMPLCRTDNENQMGIISCTVSILATPMDFRIYMDFGGMAVNYRREYYDFLSSDQYRDIALTFVSKPNFKVFDTEWFCFITKQKSMCSWLTGSSDFRGSDIKAAKEEISNYDENVSKQITWNRMLHGFIFDREYLAEQGCINIDLVKRCLTEIINFNSAFEEFRSQRRK